MTYQQKWNSEKEREGKRFVGVKQVGAISNSLETAQHLH
jgi:hypothetical protein